MRRQFHSTFPSFLLLNRDPDTSLQAAGICAGDLVWLLAPDAHEAAAERVPAAATPTAGQGAAKAPRREGASQPQRPATLASPAAGDAAAAWWPQIVAAVSAHGVSDVDPAPKVKVEPRVDSQPMLPRTMRAAIVGQLARGLLLRQGVVDGGSPGPQEHRALLVSISAGARRAAAISLRTLDLGAHVVVHGYVRRAAVTSQEASAGSDRGSGGCRVSAGPVTARFSTTVLHVEPRYFVAQGGAVVGLQQLPRLLRQVSDAVVHPCMRAARRICGLPTVGGGRWNRGRALNTLIAVPIHKMCSAALSFYLSCQPTPATLGPCPH